MSRFKKGDRVRHLFHKTPPIYRVGVVQSPVGLLAATLENVVHVEWDYLEKRHPNGVTTRTPCLDRYGRVPKTELMHDDIVSALGDLA